MSKTRTISARNRRKNKEKSKVCPGKCTDTRQGKNKKNIGNYMEHKLGKH